MDGRWDVQGSEPYFGTSQLNNKRAGHGGGGWHSHHVGGGVDFLPQPCTDVDEYHSAALTSLTLACETTPRPLPADGPTRLACPAGD